jgi:ADP-ribosylglycohydrolase
MMNSDSYADCVLKAVNLGDDTDTVAAVAGGLAGLFYGYDNIPVEWIDVIQKKDWIEGLLNDLFD